MPEGDNKVTPSCSEDTNYHTANIIRARSAVTTSIQMDFMSINKYCLIKAPKRIHLMKQNR